MPADSFPGKATTGDPVKIGLINNEGGQAVSQPENREAAEAAVAYANDELGAPTAASSYPADMGTCDVI
ncbi:hypothetical protein ACFYVR_11295 [Rhodococcus sp. NPDC003318]|uniref:hypothetical protein n=1 Tax=Rhodococcus sp. NPDC003318 TaxID=3364503 RepID=UPI0036768158